MTQNQPGPGGADVGFAERLLEVIDSGRRTATYKLAVLIALLDLCARHSDSLRRAARLLYTRDIAEQVAGLYWPQVIPYLVPGSPSAVELRQITLPRAAIIAAVSGFRRAADAAGAPSWHLARQRLPGPYESMLDQVEVTVAQQPLPRLQAVGSTDTVFPFIYELGWGPRESFSPGRLRRHGPRGPSIRLLPGAGDELIRLGPLVRPLVELHWTRMVADINGVATAELDLHRHLFGSDRVLPPAVLRDGIAALQDNRCFYCGQPLAAAPQADHFIPRIRCGIDAVENLVLADRRCNNDKRDLLPGLPYVTAWARRNQRYGGALADLATAGRWDSAPEATVAVARSIYSHLPPSGTPLWLGFKEVGPPGSYPDRTPTGKQRRAYEHEDPPWHYVTVSPPALLGARMIRVGGTSSDRCGPRICTSARGSTFRRVAAPALGSEWSAYRTDAAHFRAGYGQGSLRSLLGQPGRAQEVRVIFEAVHPEDARPLRRRRR